MLGAAGFLVAINSMGNFCHLFSASSFGVWTGGYAQVAPAGEHRYEPSQAWTFFAASRIFGRHLEDTNYFFFLGNLLNSSEYGGFKRSIHPRMAF